MRFELASIASKQRASHAARMLRAAWVGALWVAAAMPALSHHSISAVYDGRRQATLTAVVREFRFVNPHPKIVVDIVEATGDAVGDESPAGPWTLEMDNRWELAELGFDERTLSPGDEIVVTGSLARDEPRALYVRALDHAASGLRYRHHR